VDGRTAVFDLDQQRWLNNSTPMRFVPKVILRFLIALGSFFVIWLASYRWDDDRMPMFKAMVITLLGIVLTGILSRKEAVPTRVWVSSVAGWPVFLMMFSVIGFEIATGGIGEINKAFFEVFGFWTAVGLILWSGSYLADTFLPRWPTERVQTK
jgi:hypothetical protein